MGNAIGGTLRFFSCAPRGPRGWNCATRIWSCIPTRVGSDCLNTFLNQSYVPLPNLWCTAPNLGWTAANPGFTTFGSSLYFFGTHFFSHPLPREKFFSLLRRGSNKILPWESLRMIRMVTLVFLGGKKLMVLPQKFPCK